MTTVDSPIEVRASTPDDREAVLALLSTCLGWSSDARYREYFAWKHDENPVGRSPAWVAVDGGEIIGFRTFLRWEHEADDGRVHRSVRAVDTATHPAYRGMGVFRRLTLHALDDLRAEGDAFVFNTPNQRSRPGYLKMGWTALGRLPVEVRVTSPTSAVRMLRSRVPAERWSVPVAFGHDAREVLASEALDDLLQTLPPRPGLHTRLTSSYLRWRYGFEPLAYRVLTVSDRLSDGLVVFRLRRRGATTECVLCEVLMPDGAGRACRRLIRYLARHSGATHVIRTGGSAIDLDGFVRLPSVGPILTWHPLRPGAPGARQSDWELGMGDIELF